MGDNAGTTVDHSHATVAGGQSNTASGQWSTIGGGQNNTASGPFHATVGGGFTNTASAQASVVAGGSSNIASAPGASVAGGGYDGTTTLGNLASGNASHIGGGLNNKATDDYSTVAGGQNNQAGNNAGTTADHAYATIGGGQNNTASGLNATIGGGRGNLASGSGAFIGGGGFDGSLVGGNTASGNASAVVGGLSNNVSGLYSVIVGGASNTLAGLASIIGNGYGNNITAAGPWSAIAGGVGLTLTGQMSFGFNAGASYPGNAIISASRLAYFGNVDLWLGNTDNTARGLRFYQAQNTTGAFPTASTFYSGFKANATAQTDNYSYALPSTAPTTGQVLTATTVAGTNPIAVGLTWQTPAAGSTLFAITSINNASSPYAASNADRVISADVSAGNIIINLPAANTFLGGQTLIIRVISPAAPNTGNTVTINVAGGDVADDNSASATFVTGAAWNTQQSLKLYSDGGTHWYSW